MLDPHWTLEFAASASRALEYRFLGNMRAEERRFGSRPVGIQICPQPQNHFLRIQHLACVVSRALLRAAAAFHAGERLESLDARDIFARDQSEIFVARQLRDIGKSLALQEDRRWAQNQMEMFRVR